MQIFKLLHIKMLAWLLVPVIGLAMPASAASNVKPTSHFVNMSLEHVKAVNVPSGIKETPNSTSATQSKISSTAPDYSSQPHQQSNSEPTTTPQSINSDADKEQVADPNGLTYDAWGNEFSATGQLIQFSALCVDPISGAINPYNPGCNAPNACVGESNGVCEFNPAISQCLQNNTCGKND